MVRAKQVESDDEDFVESVSTRRKISVIKDTRDVRIKQFTDCKVDIEKLRKLTLEYPDQHWLDLDQGIQYINKRCPLIHVPGNISDRLAITGLSISPSTELLATFSSAGTCLIWDLETFDQLQSLHDKDEENIDEFYVGCWSQCSKFIVTGGVIKDRNRWSETTDDNYIHSSPLKVFDIEAGQVVSRFDGHEREISSIKSLIFKRETGLSINGAPPLRSSFNNLISQQLTCTKINDPASEMVFALSFIPNTGNKYFIAACDDTIRVFDFEKAECIDFEQPPDWNDVTGQSPMFCYIISRGVEMLDGDRNTVNTTPNSIILHKLIYTEDGFELDEVMRYLHEDYHSNSWPVNLTSNGRYVASPTDTGSTFVFHLKTGEVAAILSHHGGNRFLLECGVRDVVFHPTRKLMFTSGDDGKVMMYRQD